VSYFIQEEIIGFQVLLDSLHPRYMMASNSSPRGKLLRSLDHSFIWKCYDKQRQYFDSPKNFWELF